MSRQRKCRVCDGWHDLAEAWPPACAAHYAPRGQRTHYVIPDSMADTRHPVTQRVHDSKSAFRRDTRASGCVEMGNDVPQQSRPQLDPVERPGRTIKRTLEELRGR